MFVDIFTIQVLDVSNAYCNRCPTVNDMGEQVSNEQEVTLLCQQMMTSLLYLNAEPAATTGILNVICSNFFK